MSYPHYIPLKSGRDMSGKPVMLWRVVSEGSPAHYCIDWYGETVERVKSLKKAEAIFAKVQTWTWPKLNHVVKPDN